MIRFFKYVKRIGLKRNNTFLTLKVFYEFFCYSLYTSGNYIPLYYYRYISKSTEISEAYLELWQTFMMKLFWENS